MRALGALVLASCLRRLVEIISPKRQILPEGVIGVRCGFQILPNNRTALEQEMILISNLLGSRYNLCNEAIEDPYSLPGTVA